LLTKVINLKGKTEVEAFEVLYVIFCRDFVEQKTYLNNSLYVDPSRDGMRNGKEGVFWHVTTREKRKRVKRGNVYRDDVSRVLDPDRAVRIGWIRPMLENIAHDDIHLFYRKETKGKKPVRLYLWAYRHDFVVIVQKLGQSSSFLVTSFYITERYKKESYDKWLRDYLDKKDKNLNGCEWF